MRIWRVGLVLTLGAMMLVGCGGEEATPAAADEGDTGGYTSAALDTSYADALNVRSQLMLGTMQLEGTEDAVTPEQAAALLPLWQSLQGGVTAEAEVAAVLKQIEGTMTGEQLEAIAALQLTQGDMQAWMQEQGPNFGGGPGQGDSPDARPTRQAEFGEGEPPFGEGEMPFGDGEVPPEMATRRAEFGNMSDEERAAMRATAEAGGMGMPGGRSGAGQGTPPMLLGPLIELLTARAAE